MKNLFFIAFAILFASCSTDLMESVQPIENAQTVSSRTSSVVEVGCEVASFEIIIEDGILYLVNFDSDLEDLVIEDVQTIVFDNLVTGQPEFFQVDVLSFEIIIEDGILYFQMPSIDIGNYEIAAEQTLNFVE